MKNNIIRIMIMILFILSLTACKSEDIKEDINRVDQVYGMLKKENIEKDFIKNFDDKTLDKIHKYLLNHQYDKSMWHEITGYSYKVLINQYQHVYDNMDNIKIIDSNKPSIISIVGDVSLADNWHIMPEYDARGKNIYGILSEEVVDIMKKSDVMIVNSEFTVSDRGTPMDGKLYTFRAKKERLSIYNEMGVDLVTLANNHVYDYGKDAFLDMLDAFDEINMPRIGAGRNLEEAMKPYFFIINGYKVAILNATRAEKYIMTPGAEENKEGVFRCYDTTNMINQIKKAKETSDFVIAIIHYGKEGYHDLEEEQINSSKQYIDAGCDAVVGHHAHTLQGVEIYKDKPIIYNLGNFIFNNEIDDTAILQMKIEDNGTIEYKMIPAIQHNCYTELLKGNEKQRVINELNSWSINAYIDENGKILKIER